MKCWLAAGLAGLLAATGLAQKKPFTLDDLYRLKSITDPQVDPRGERIAFVVTSYELKSGRTTSAIHVVGLGGRDLRRLTQGTGLDYHPRWSPDGGSLLFVSTRTGVPQIHVMDMAGGEPRQLTSLSTGVDQPAWSPDGKRIVFGSTVFPEYGADDAQNRRDDHAMKTGPVQAHLADRLLYRHWTTWLDGKCRHLFVLDVKNGAVKDLTPGEGDVPPRYAMGSPGFAISPDGQEVCFVANPDDDPWQSTNADLRVVSIDGGEARNLTADNPAYDGQPRYSPDGRYIAFRRQTQPGYEADRFRLAVYDRTEKTVQTLTEDFDRWVRDLAWAPDSSVLYFTADDQGHVPLFRVSVQGGEVTSVLDAKSIHDFRITPDGRWIVFTRSGIAEPVELFRAHPGGQGQDLLRLTAFNQPVVKEVDIRPAEVVWVKGAGDYRIQVFVVKPHGFDPAKKYPVILNVRGGPQGMWADSFRGDWQIYPGAGYVVAFPNPTGSTGFGQAFTAAISQDWAGRVYDDLMKVTDALAALPYVDEKRMGAMGWSWGGYMMMWFEGHTDRFQALASMMGVYDLSSMYRTTEELWFPEWDLGGTPWSGAPSYERFSPSRFVPQFKTPCLVLTGEQDFRVSYTQSLQFFTDLQKRKVPSRLIVFKNDGHWPDHVKSMPLYYNAHLDWFHRYLGGLPAPYDVKAMVRNRGFETGK